MSGSIQSRGITTTQTLPLTSLLRPIPPVLDQSKITRMVSTLHSDTTNGSSTPEECEYTPGHLPPVDVLHYKNSAGKDFYFAFGGCHRLVAYERAGVEGVECKVLKVTKGMLKVYLGGSVDAIVGE